MSPLPDNAIAGNHRIANLVADDNDRSDSNLLDLITDLDDIYRNYSHNHGDDESVESLDSDQNRAPNPIASSLKAKRIHPLSSLQHDDDYSGSGPQTPTSESSFDFNSHAPALTNSSLNVLLDTPTTQSEYQELISTPPMIEVEYKRNDDDDNDNDSNSNSNEPPASASDSPSNLDVDSDGIPISNELKQNSEHWNDKGAAVRQIEDGDKYKIIRRTVQDFKFGRNLGEGSYSTVVLATDKVTNKQYAVKILDKRHIIKEKKVKYVNIEKHALNRLSNRMGIISLYFTFQDKTSLYFVLDYASNGELLSLIKKYTTLSEDCTRHFGAQILDAIKFMHNNGVIHRDIKPENILLDDKLRIQITDFGTARLLEKKNDTSEEYPVDVRAKSFVGTAEYVSPELLESKYCGKPGDIWAFGCIIYQMIAGKPPFRAPNEYLTFQKITKLQYAFSAGFPTVIRDLVKQIFVLQPSKRATISDIERHYFFLSVDFNDFDQIWYSEIPELGPYKMTAKSMMKVPELTKTSSQAHFKTKKMVNNGKRTNGESKRAVNPASAAAFVLKKDDKRSTDDLESDLEDSTGPEDSEPISSSSSRLPAPESAGSTSSTKVPAPEYIPGTNILRPTIPIRQSYSRHNTSSLSQTKKSITRLKSKVMEVTPINTVETAWQEFLNHADERILKIGPTFTHKLSTEAFQKKHKGLIHNAPLGYVNKLQATNASTRGGGTSLLSQVVNGSKSGLRSEHEAPHPDHQPTVDDESLAIIEYVKTEEHAPENFSSPARADTQDSNHSTSTKRGKNFLKKFLGGGDKKDSSAGDTSSIKSVEPVKAHPLEKPRPCTVIITTHGRVLIFYRKKDEDGVETYKFCTEIFLNYPFILFKEVVSSNSPAKSQRGGPVPTTGLFAVESSQSTFVFEVEHFEINQWTEALAKAKLNQFEREKEQEMSRSSTRSTTNGNSSSSTRLLDAPSFKRTNSSLAGRSTRSDRSQITVTPEDNRSPRMASPDNKHYNMMANKMKLKGTSTKRKPPPPLKSTSSLNMSTGLGQAKNGEKEDSAMLHAAQLAVSNNAHIPVTNNRRSSFTKDHETPSRPRTSHSTSSSSTAKNGQAKITSMNSKFLARSQRKK